jgi:hypothetical protein
MRRALHAKAIDLGRQRHRTAHERTGALGGIDDALGRLVENSVIVRFETNTNLLL